MSNIYFVTGATGAVGSALVPLLLEDPNNRIWIVLRGETDVKVQARLEELIVYWEMNVSQAVDARLRVFPLKGDTDLPKFDLTDEIYEKIARECTHIIHCAGVVRMNLPIEIARQHSVSSTKNIVELAKASKSFGNHLKKIEFVSTVGVGGCMRGVLPETWITTPREFHNTYEQAKAEAEDFLKEQINLYQLPVTVHRPSMVVGDSRTGKIIHYQVFYHICEFLTGRRSFGILPVLGNVCLDTVPVDYVAEVLRWSALQENQTGNILHLCAGPEDSIQLVELQKMVREMMENNKLKMPKLISLKIFLFDLLFKAIGLFTTGKTKRSIKTIPFFLNYLKVFQGFGNQETKKILYQSSGPKLSDKNIYLKIVLNNYIKKNY